MIIVMAQDADEKMIELVSKEIEAGGLKPFVSRGTERTIIGAIGNERKLSVDRLKSLPGVERVVPVLSPFKLVGRGFHTDNTVVNVKGVEIGSKNLVVIAGPCAVESEEQLLCVARAVKDAGASILRGSAFKPRTSPYDFQGLGVEALKILRSVGRELGIPVETEVMDTRQVGLVAKYVDMLRIGARNMQNFALLREVGRTNKPVILKNGLASTIKEFLMAAEYIMSEGNANVVLCNRGVRTPEPELRFPVLCGSTALLKRRSHLPVVVDPSHSTGSRELVAPVAKASVAEGADGLMVEVHNCPERALCDGVQQLTVKRFAALMAELKKIAFAVGRGF